MLTPPDFDEALASPRYQALAEVARSMREKSGDFADLPSKDSDSNTSVGGIGRSSRPNADVISSMFGRYKAEQTRITNAFTRKMRALEALSPEDLRMLGATDAMLNQLMEGSSLVKGVKKFKTAKP